MATVALSATAQDSCVVFGDVATQPKMMGFLYDPVTLKNINYVVHIHHTDSSIYDYSYFSEDLVLDAHEKPNEEIEEAMFNFDLHGIEYQHLGWVEGGQE